MTNQEAIELIKVAQAEVEWSCPMGYAAAFDLAIKALEQTDVLDKIRAEIENIEEGISSYHNDRPWLYKDEVLQIIDKYKAESEVKDADSD